MIGPTLICDPSEIFFSLFWSAVDRSLRAGGIPLNSIFRSAAHHLPKFPSGRCPGKSESRLHLPRGRPGRRDSVASATLIYRLTMDSASEIVLDVSPFFRVHRDGSVERLMGTGTVPASEGDESVASKDVIVDARSGVYVRLFLPRVENRGIRLPVVLYVHGGGFCVESAASPTYHNYLYKMAREAEVICASVDYRRVPEHRLPAAYDDCFSALEWLRRQAEGGDGAPDPWLRSHADFANCYLAGDSAGANIVHNMGIRAGMAWGASEGGLCIRGAILVHPFFAGRERIGSEPTPHPRYGMLRAGLPEGEDEDYFGFNPVGPRSPSVSALVYPRLLVVVAEKDFLKDRGLWYYDILRKNSGKHVGLLMTEDEPHVFHLKDLHCENAHLMMKCIADFIHSQNP